MAGPGLIVLAGPTASGKSDLAARLADSTRGTIINADSVQLYRDLRILTARPSAADEAVRPHRLYGILDAARPGSVGDWLHLAGRAIDDARATGRVPVVVGGSGLYLEALLEGISPMPDIPDGVREEVRASFRDLGRDGLYQRLRERDPVMAGRLVARDPQRVMRALEVLAATGRSLASWQDEPRQRVALPPRVARIALLPPREALRGRIARRLASMIEAGALDELEAVRRRRLSRELPLMKALAVPDLLDHLEGRIGLDEARERATAATRRYAKRQATWIRHRLRGFETFEIFGEEVSPDRVLGGAFG